MDFSEKLQQLRKRENLTQEELSQRLYVSRTAVSKWESGRGVPNIESLRAISRLFGLSIDELLSGEELLSMAETESRERAEHTRDLIYGILDCMAAILLFLPFFGQLGPYGVENVSLLRLTEEFAYIRIPYLILVSLTVLTGVATLALQNLRAAAWRKTKRPASLLLSMLAAAFFIASRQPYAALFALFTLVAKGALLIKRP